ncbi:hypothetical protein lbkm_0245 [Lachnospiraceae bacterium KM106-2]|nr:hypothetical protein lbkm_0245 [Lachnospiraceae bacterium KM106-2]
MKRIKMLTDICMIILMPLLMLYSLIGEALHEWFGIAMLSLFLMHNLLNWRWHKNLFTGKYNLQRTVRTVVNIMISVCMILTGISGIIMSNYVFHLEFLSDGISLARKLHLVCSHWLFVLTSIHAGMHLNVMKGYLGKGTVSAGNKFKREAIQMIKAILFILGIWFFVTTNTWDYMTYQISFMFLDFSRPAIVTHAEYVFIMILFFIVGDGLSSLMKCMAVRKQKRSIGE